MDTKEQLRTILHRIDGKGYKAYKDIQGSYSFQDFAVFCHHIQGDPFASPSRIRVRVDRRKAGFNEKLFCTHTRKVALQDYLTRAFAKAAKSIAKGNRGTGKSGLIAIADCGQEILERTSVVVSEDYVEARFLMGLPAAGRRILGAEAEQMFFVELPKIVKQSLFAASLDMTKVRQHVELAEDADFIRNQLKTMGLVAFIGDGAILPRESGISDKPMESGRVIPFKSPDSLRVEMDLPNSGRITGAGIKEGITLIVGGGYHGKSTLLKALERGVYNHIAGDGREYVITRSDAVKIRAEDGRGIEKVNISPFINNLPYGQDTVAFSSENASGSTSQAANIIEALEVGAKVLLIDEDTSATNFMIRDVRMQELVAKEKEPITPFIDKARQLYEELGVSTVIVVGGSGDYFDVADTVIMMDEYKALDVTEKARSIAQKHMTKRHVEGGEKFGTLTSRVPTTAGFDPQKGRKTKVDAKGLHTIVFGHHSIDLDYLEQLVDTGQTRAIADAILYSLRNYVDGKRTLKKIIDLVVDDINKKGLDILSPFHGQYPGDYTLPRRFELAAAINRLRTLRIR